MTERKLINETDHSTFVKAFEKVARLPTEEDRKAALEQTADDMRAELYAPKYEPGGGRLDTRRAPGNGTGWTNLVPLSVPDGIGLIDNIVDALSPQPKPRVNIQSLKGISPEVVRQKLAQAVAEGRITQAQCEEQLSLLGGTDA